VFNPFERAQEALKEIEAKPELDVPASPIIPEPKWLYGFCKEIMEYNDMQPQPHYEVCNFLEHLLGDRKFKRPSQEAGIILLPRDTFKTVISVTAVAVATIVENPNVRILVTSHTQKQANKRASSIRRVIERSEKFGAKYGEDWKPEFREDKWTDAEFTVARRTKNLIEATVTAAAVGADVTGSHFDLIISDDIVNLENSYTQEARDKVYNYLTSLFPHLEPGGTMLIVGTRWHMDDAYGRLIKNDEERSKAGLPPRYEKLIRGCYDGPNGLFFPAKLTHEYLERMRYDLKPASRFSANYENKTIADEDLIFEPQYKTLRDFSFLLNQSRSGTGIVVYNNEQIPVDTIMCWDTAGTKSTARSDYHGLVVRGQDSQGQVWSIAAEQMKGHVSEVVARVVSLVSAYRPRLLIIEAVGSFDHWREKVEEALLRYGVSVEIVESKHKGIPKEERIAMLEPLWSSRRLILGDGQSALEAQFANFTMLNKLYHDDVIDSFAMGEGYHMTPDEHATTKEENPIDTEWLYRQSRMRASRRRW
jgi:hypothetical protein